MKNSYKYSYIIIIFLMTCMLKSAKIEASYLQQTSPLIINEEGRTYSNMFKILYKKKLIDLKRGDKAFDKHLISDPDFINTINVLKNKYGDFTIEKHIPNAMPEDTFRINKRTKKNVRVVDMSQIYDIIFTRPAPIDSVVLELKKNKNISSTVTPTQVNHTTSPNDTYYLDPNYRWSFDVLNASQAWDITRGSSDINVAVVDQFGGVAQLHSELNGKVSWNNLSGDYGGHGVQVAGVVGATTNNGEGIASLGWNTSVQLDWREGWYFDQAVYDLVNNHDVDVINVSWEVYSPDVDKETAVLYALQNGVVVVASGGNNDSIIPSVRWPAGYDFGIDAKVIVATATELVSGNEQKIDIFNFSPSGVHFIDFAAPGSNYKGLSTTSSSNYDHVWVGSSIATPFVSSLVALILSVNGDLEPIVIYNILRNSTDKIDQTRHPDDLTGWNQYTGYGRINAYKALKYTLEHYGGTLSQSVTIPSVESWNFQSGITINFASGCQLIVNGTMNANGVTFGRSGSSGNWNGIQFNSGSSGTLQYCTIQNATNGIS